MPFALMTIIYYNRNNVKKLEWRRRDGMLTEELNNKDILQLYYYPIFMY
jgi:hypothetical protein